MKVYSSEESLRLPIQADLAMCYVSSLVLWRKSARKGRHHSCYFEEVRKETRFMVYESGGSSSNYVVRAFLRMELEKFLFVNAILRNYLTVKPSDFSHLHLCYRCIFYSQS